MWFITLLVLAVAAVLIIKAVKAHSERQSANTEDQTPTPGLQGSLKRPEPASDGERASSMPDTEESVLPSTQTAATPVAQNSDQADSSSTLHDIREMIKTLNLTDSDSPRLGISSDEFNALRNHEGPDSSTPSLPDSTTQADVAERLRRMLN